MTYALVAVLGLAAGVISGLFGVGGAIVVVPGLVLLAKLPQHTANGTSLGALLLPVGLLGFLQYYKRGQVNLGYAAHSSRKGSRTRRCGARSACSWCSSPASCC